MFKKIKNFTSGRTWNNKNKEKQKAFTLIELMVSITLFSVVILIAIGALMMVIDSSHQAKTIKSVINNLHIVVEGMSREIRMGYDYTCSADSEGDIVTEEEGGTDCPNGDNKIGFHTKENNGWALYKLEGGAIERYLNEGVNRDDGGFLRITDESIKVENLTFTVVGTDPGDNIQPRVLINITGEAKITEDFKTKFSIQTTVSQRNLAP